MAASTIAGSSNAYINVLVLVSVPEHDPSENQDVDAERIVIPRWKKRLTLCKIVFALVSVGFNVFSLAELIITCPKVNKKLGLLVFTVQTQGQPHQAILLLN